MNNISLVTFAAKTVTPQDDALIYESALGAGGIIYGAEVTVKNANTLHVNAGHGVICGRKFTVYDSDVPVTLSASGTLLGRLYIHLDLSNASDPIEMLVETGQSLSPLEQDEDVNIVNGIYDINIATFDVSTSAITNLRNVYPKVAYANSGSLITITTQEPSLIGEEVTVTDGTDYVYAVFNAEGVAELKNVLMTGSLTISATDGEDIATDSLNVPYYGSYELDLAFWNATLAITTPNSELYGQQITIKNSSDVTVGTTQFGGSGTASFVVKEPDTYTVSVTYGGSTFANQVAVTTQTTYNVTISLIPNGATVTPTDDIQTWLKCGGIFDKNYTIISQVLSDTTTLLALVNNNNAVDYMVRSTTWASDTCSNELAMTYIGANNYAADTLLADSTWLSAICNSTYFESVLNVKVPVMTSNTMPSGIVGTNTQYSSGDPAWYAFDGNDTTGWSGASTGSSASGSKIWYKFENSISVKKVKIIFPSQSTANRYTEAHIIAGNSENSMESIEQLQTPLNVYNSYNINNDSYYDYYGVELTQATDRANINTIQFYGRAAS